METLIGVFTALFWTLHLTYNLKYSYRQVADSLQEMSNSSFVDNKKQYQIFIYSVCPESAKVKKKQKLVTVFSEKSRPPTPPHTPKFFSFSTALIMKIRSISPKSNQFFVMSQLYYP